MRRSLILASAVIVAGAIASVADAQPVAPPGPPPVSVQVGLGPAVAHRLDDLGREELRSQQTYLGNDVVRALARAKTPPTRITLQIADIEPNLPTSNQLGLSPQLKANSHGIGGAAVTGEIVLADGTRLPVRYRWFQDELRNESNFTVWGDADEAFDNLATLLAAGRVPNDTKMWPPAHQARAMTGTRIPG